MNKIVRNLLIFIALLGIPGVVSIYAQGAQQATVTVTGQVVDESGQPVPNIVVSAFYSKMKAITDAQGNFSIMVASDRSDRLVVDERGFKLAVDSLQTGVTSLDPIQLLKERIIDPGAEIDLPYGNLNSERLTGSIDFISGEELESYPTDNLLDALMGRIPGLVIDYYSYAPGQESATALIRGSVATIYIDGVARDITGLSASEIDKVAVIKDFSGRALLGLTGSGPVLWITTKKGERYNRKITASVESGFRSPASLPKYLDAFNYATLYNEALANDGLTPLYSAGDLAGYQNHSNPVLYPDIDYYGEYLNKNSNITRADITFQGGDDRVTYFSAFNYLGTEGLESIGESINNDRYKLRGNVDIKLNDFMRLGVNISASYNKQRFPNSGSGSGVFNVFDPLSTYPANAHPIYSSDKLIISDNFPLNVTNELMYAGYAEGQVLNAQNSANLFVDLGGIVSGLSLNASASFDIMNNIIQNKGGTAALYRLEGTDAELITPELNVVSLSVGSTNFARRTESLTTLRYQTGSGKHSLIADATYYMALDEIRSTYDDYQPNKIQDVSLRANYSFDNKYILQLDLAYSGSMRMPAGEKFSLYPTFGAAWIASKEGFLEGSNFIDYLKLNASFGIMGIGDYSLSGYNPYYLYETLWSYGGSWRSGISGSTGSSIAVYNILQEESTDFTLPKKRIFNIGMKSEFMDRAFTFEVNYFNEYNYDKISSRTRSLPAIYGTEFLPATNYGEDVRWGVDGMLQYTKTSGDITFSVGVNGLYLRGKYITVDEPDLLDDYRKLAGKDMDLFWLYNAEGLFQSAGEITSRNVEQAWGDLKPGDIRYEDYNDDNLVDEFDIYAPGAHSPRFFYGLNMSVGYKGFRLFVLGEGIADGDLMLSSSRYFRINGTLQNYSELMLDRWPETNDIPRLTTSSYNNIQNSTFWLRNAAYFKVKNIELSYTLPKLTASKIFMEDFRVFIRATNLLVLSELNKYNVDPENINAGITGYPVFKAFTAGISCSF